MATKTATKKSNTATKKPTWSVITFKQIESRRQQLGFSKSGIAKALGVTNSTYHNWQRGTTVPHPTQQESIKSILAGLTPGSTPTAPAGGTGRAKRGPKASASGAGGRKGGRSSLRTDARVARNVDGGSPSMPAINAEGHPLYPTTPDSVRGIAQITSAWITSQNKAPSAGSVFEFVDGLKDVLGS